MSLEHGLQESLSRLLGTALSYTRGTLAQKVLPKHASDSFLILQTWRAFSAAPLTQWPVP